MAANLGTMCFDDYGRAFIILQDQERQARLCGLEAVRSHILAARRLADTLRSSLGPKGMDKLLVSPDGEVVITNDGATILELMDVEHEVAKLMVSLARAQDREVGDGTTGVVVLAGALLERALELLDKGVHPTRVAEGYERAARSAARHLDNISWSVTVDPENTEWLLLAAMTALSSKVASRCQAHLAELAVRAVKLTCDMTGSEDLLVNSVVLRGKSGGQIEDTKLVRGVIIGKDFAHPQMKKRFEKAKIGVFSGSALQLPKVNTKHQLNVNSSKSYDEISAYMDEWCRGVLKILIESGVELIVSAGKIDEGVIHLLLQQGISAVDEVPDVQLVAAAVGAHVVPKIEELDTKRLGVADKVRIIDLGTVSGKFIAVERLEKAKIVTIFVRGGNEVVVEEVKRSLQDALCVIRNLIKDSSVVYGGGAAEISCSLALQEQSLSFPDLDHLVYRAFAEALDAIPTALAENAGLYPLLVLTELKAGHKPSRGVDCALTGDCDMHKQGVVEGLQAKKHQLVLATQLAKMVLKIDDVRGPKDEIKK
uniref:T-complex protein 1 subunit epsilon n=1 Tax=Graphocephala atropunctata TaxID=36148 RepID=A0A1B6LAX1_9HEMI